MVRRGSNDPDTIKARLEIAERELENSKIEGFHDIVLVNDDLKETYKKLSSYVFGGEESLDGSSPLTPVDEPAGSPAIVDAEVEMVDSEVPEAGSQLEEETPGIKDVEGEEQNAPATNP